MGWARAGLRRKVVSCGTDLELLVRPALIHPTCECHLPMQRTMHARAVHALITAHASTHTVIYAAIHIAIYAGPVVVERESEGETRLLTLIDPSILLDEASPGLGRRLTMHEGVAQVRHEVDAL